MQQMQSEQVNELFAALAKAQGEIKAAQKDSANPFFKSRYADLSSVMDACKDALSKNGLSVMQTPSIENGMNVLITTLGHASGQWIKSVCPLLMAKNDAQSYGAACTYMRRFALAAMVGVCPEDDDGEKERERLAKEEEKARKLPPKKDIDKPTPPMVKRLGEILLKCPQEFRDETNKSLDEQGYKMLDDIPLDKFMQLVKNAKIAAGDLS